MLGAKVMSQGNRDAVILVKFDIFVNFVKFVFPKGRNFADSSHLLKAVAPNKEVPSAFSTSVRQIDRGYRPLLPSHAQLAAWHGAPVKYCYASNPPAPAPAHGDLPWRRLAARVFLFGHTPLTCG